ncbi:11296_t:CDS:2 [Funneliformis mosseae]|uniref:11296_t:CDS:1 n=1 Tax=Funneliformis mosseae TaxID=27381 RepID=A0A9N9AWY6_FUNMO|nr:11296_t:CDS:2 [Funneliformis mosseae]
MNGNNVELSNNRNSTLNNGYFFPLEIGKDFIFCLLIKTIFIFKPPQKSAIRENITIADATKPPTPQQQKRPPPPSKDER